MTEANQERRHFHRIVMHRPVTIDCKAHPVEAELLDISLNGALVSLGDSWKPQIGNQAKAAIRLDDDDEFTIHMAVRVAHVRDGHVGLQVTSIDLDSATTLRRLVELNLADPALLERELEQLTSVGNT